MTDITIRRALLSVSDKSGIVVDRGLRTDAEVIELDLSTGLGDVAVIVAEGVDAELHGWTVLGNRRTELAPVPRLAGSHQAQNAGLAIAMLRHQEAVSVPPAALRAAMGWAEWPARLRARVSLPE